jgi:O-antigen/teichoic acid export membrane protein
MSRLTLLKNAFANLCRGGATALVTLLLPPFLTRILDKDAYGTWLLILQLSAYVGFLDFGIQTAVGRFVAHCNELGDFERRDSIISTSIAILSGAAVLAMGGISIVAWQLPHIFKDLPINLHQDARLALLCVGASLSVSLPFSVFGAIFVGLQRYVVPAWIVGTSKLIGGIFVIFAAQYSRNIVIMSIVIAISNVLSGIWLYVAYRNIQKEIKISTKKISKATAMEISSYCFGILICNIAMLMIGGLDTTIIAIFDYQSLVYYTLAASLTIFVVGVQNSMLAVIMPQAAMIGARGENEELGHLLISSTRYSVILIILISLPLLVLGKLIISLWAGQIYTDRTFLFLQLLVIGNGIRQVGAPYSLISLAIGEQKQIILSPIIEGSVNLIFSLLCVRLTGDGLGVTVGTIIGGISSIMMHLFYNLPRSKMFIKDNKSLIIAVFCPALAILPSLIFLFFDRSLNYLSNSVLSLSSIILGWGLLWIYGIPDREKNKIISNVTNRIKSSKRQS